MAERLAKTARPAARRAMPRPRLFRVLDQARMRPATWVWSPPGAGKTTLVSSYIAARRLPGLWYNVDEGDEDLASFFYYLRESTAKGRQTLPLLTPEYMAGLTVFAQRFFRQLFAHPQSGFAVVLDNYQTVGSGARLHEVLATAVENVPPLGRLIVISRETPPPAFARLTTNQAVALVDYEALRLTDREAHGLVRRLGRGRRASTTSKRLVETANGWAGGLVLLSAHHGRDGTRIPRPERADNPPQALFDYFALQVFATLDAEAQQVLMQTAFLPRTTAAMAVALTGVPHAGKVLAGLVRRNYFTSQRSEAQPVYQYHDLFREFLQARARAAFAPDERADVQRRAAGLLADAGEFGAAASLFHDAADWEGLSRLIESRAGEMLGQGRSQTVEEWLADLPQSWVAEAPWLLHWRGMCRMPSDPGLAREDFERALPLFRIREDPSGAFLAWSAAADAYPHEAHDARPLDHWIAVLDDLLREFSRFPSRAVEEQVVTSMFVSLMWRRPDHPEMPTWTQRAFEVLRTSRALPLRVQAGLFLVVHHYWLGRMTAAREALDVLQAVTAAKDVPTLLVLLAKIATAGYQFMAAELRECQETVAAAVRHADTTGVHVWTFHFLEIGASAALSSGDLETARRFLSQMATRLDRARPLDVTYHQHLIAWRALIEGDLVLAASSAEAAVAGSIEVGMPLVEAMWRNLLAQVRQAQGKTSEAAAEVARSLRLARAMGNRLLEWAGGLIQAQIALDRGNQARGLATLARALAVGRQDGLVNIWTWHPSAFARLCATALAHGIEVDYVRSLIRKRGLRLHPPPVDLEQWPWPVKVSTLGGFRLYRDEQPIVFTGKVQKRPLALLKALLASGARGVREDVLAEALWPEAEADAAARSLSITLHRLRLLLGHDGSVVRQGGELRLDSGICWVDAWAFESCLAHAGAPSLPEALKWTYRAAELYRGPFLDGAPDVPGAVAVAERLQGKWCRHLSGLARQLSAAGRDEEAIQWYDRAIELDDASEDCYRGLMTAYQRLGRRAEAIEVYRRYRTALTASPGLAPSRELEALHRAVRDGS